MREVARKSYVCGPDGHPLRVYHGTGAVFDQFDSRYSPSGFWFTDNPTVASRVALSPHALLVGGVANVRIAYLSMQRPLRVQTLDEAHQALEGVSDGALDGDGIIWTNATMVDPECGPFTQFVVFDAEQIQPPWVDVAERGRVAIERAARDPLTVSKL